MDSQYKLTPEEKARVEENLAIASKFFLVLVLGIIIGAWLSSRNKPVSMAAVCPESTIVETDKNLDKWDMLKRTDDELYMHAVGVVNACDRTDTVGVTIHAKAINDLGTQREETIKALGYGQ